MCIIAFSINEHPDYPLIMAANRDEFYERPTEYAHWWDGQQVLAGKDLKGGGTWLGITKTGKVAAVTNYRDPKNIREDAKTRGNLTTNFLIHDDEDIEGYLKQLNAEGGDYNGFNLLLFKGNQGFHLSNYEGKINHLAVGSHVLSNSLLNTPWPKAVRLKSNFDQVIKSEFSHESLLNILQDDVLAQDDQLPDTGIPYEWEKAISSICIRKDGYGTCCSTIITIDKAGKVEFTEQSYPVGARTNKVVKESFQLQ